MRRVILSSILLPVLCLSAHVGAQEAPETDDVYLQHRAAALNDRIELAVRERKLSRKAATRLRISVGQVQTSVGDEQSVNGRIDRGEVDRLNQQLTDVERALPRQR